MRLKSWLGFSAFGALALLSIGTLIFAPTPAIAEAPAPALNESTKLAACRKEAFDLIKPEKVDVPLLQRISDYCYGQVRGEDLLGDFNIRRTNVVRQQFQGMVFLWMLVAITLSGVIMAAVQLFVAYKLAASGRAAFEQGGELALEEKRLSVKSSVTGLLILTVSFAFFMVFVLWVYPLTEMRNAQESKPAAPAVTLPGLGGVGAPPAVPSSSADKQK